MLAPNHHHRYFPLSGPRCHSRHKSHIFCYFGMQVDSYFFDGWEREREKERERGGGNVWVGLFASRETGLRWLGGLEVVWVVWWWFGANMEGQRNKNAFKFILQVFILSQKHIPGVKKVVWCGLDVVWGGLGVVWGVSTDRNSIYTKLSWHYFVWFVSVDLVLVLLF